jgi:hypothetical protein
VGIDANLMVRSLISIPLRSPRSDHSDQSRPVLPWGLTEDGIEHL